MRGRCGPRALLAASVLAGAAACGSGSGSAAPFHPAGSLSAERAQAVALPAAAAQRFGGFRFPSGVSIDFTSPAPAHRYRRAIIAGYQDYILSMWAGVLSHGRNTRYANRAAGDALAFVAREVARYRPAGRTVRGTVRYFATRITAIYYFGTGASVVSCVDASELHDVNAWTGAKVGLALPGRPARYLEQVSEGRWRDGAWYVSRTAAYPASGKPGEMCR